MKKLAFGFSLILLCAFGIKRVAMTPVWRLMLTSELIVSGKVISQDTATVVIEIQEQISNGGKINYKPKERIKINQTIYSKNPRYRVRSAAIENNTKAIFFLKSDANSSNFNYSDRFSGILYLNNNQKIQYYNGIDYENFATVKEFTDAFLYLKKHYTIDSTGMVKNSIVKKNGFKKHKIGNYCKSLIFEIEREKSNYRR